MPEHHFLVQFVRDKKVLMKKLEVIIHPTKNFVNYYKATGGGQKSSLSPKKEKVMFLYFYLYCMVSCVYMQAVIVIISQLLEKTDGFREFSTIFNRAN